MTDDLAVEASMQQQWMLKERRWLATFFSRHPDISNTDFERSWDRSLRTVLVAPDRGDYRPVALEDVLPLPGSSVERIRADATCQPLRRVGL